jgi:hypothetical protein
MSVAIDHQTILRQIASWPAHERVVLAQEILATVSPRPSGPRSPRKTADRAHGLLRGPQPPPDDDDVKRILHEHRMEKYGR